jgi:hypothetical protein
MVGGRHGRIAPITGPGHPRSALGERRLSAVGSRLSAGAVKGRNPSGVRDALLLFPQ